MVRLSALIILSLSLTMIMTQHAGKQATEDPPAFGVSECTSSGCTKQSKKVSLDSNWRWTHSAGGATNCYGGSNWDQSLCPDVASCGENCVIDGVTSSQYKSPYGVTMSGSGDEMGLSFVNQGPYSKSIGQRLYLLDSANEYYMFKLLNKEFTLTLDVSDLPCGLNGAIYFVEMDKDGGLSYDGNTAGPSYGTGYCDAQCPHDIKFIRGDANLIDWDSTADPPGGKYGTCCAEMDIWEANSQNAQLTPHACEHAGQYRCEGTECGDLSNDERYKGVCDKDGCDFNPYRLGNTKFYGKGSDFTIDTSKVFTVVTQFITDDGTDTGKLKEIKRKWIQDGKVYDDPVTNVEGLSQYNSITDETCKEQKTLWDEPQEFENKGGLKNMGEALGRGMVLVMSLWDDHSGSQMLWLDGQQFPKGQTGHGNARGPCSDDTGKPEDLENNAPNSHYKISNVKFGAIGSTYSGTPAGGKYSCDSSSNICSQSSTGTFDSLTDCNSACGQAPSTKYACNNGACESSSSGAFSSLSDCQNSCSSTASRYDCFGGACVENKLGQFSKLSDCQTACGIQPTMKYSCSSNGCQQDASGTYSSESECQSSCFKYGFSCGDSESGKCGSNCTSNHCCWSWPFGSNPQDPNADCRCSNDSCPTSMLRKKVMKN